MNFSDVLTALAEAIMKADEARDINFTRGPFLRLPFKFLEEDLLPAPDVKLAEVGLWLIDEVDSGQSYQATLWQIVANDTKAKGADDAIDPDENPAVATIDSAVLKRTFDLRDQDAIRRAFPISLNVDNVGRLFARAMGRQINFANYSEVLLPLRAKEDERYLGVLQLVAPGQDLPHAMAENHRELAATVETIAALIDSGRSWRQIKAIETCQKKVIGITSSKALAIVLSDALRTTCSALSCAIYRPGQGKCLELIGEAVDDEEYRSEKSITQGTFTYWIYENSSKRMELNNLTHFARLSTTATIQGPPSLQPGIDLPLGLSAKKTSWLSFAVLSPAGGGIGKTAPLLFIRLLTAPHKGFLGGSFSNTARDIVTKIGAYVSKLFSDQFFNEAVAALAQRAPQLRAKFPGFVAKPDFLGLECEYGRLIKALLPSIEHVYIAQRHNAPGKDSILRTCAKEVVADTDPFEWTSRKPDEGDEILTYQAYKGTAGIDITVNSIDTYDYGLRCLFGDRTLAVHEWRVLEYIVSELRFAELSALDLSEKAQQVAEIRHALRAEMNGVAGYLAVANEEYELCLESHRSGDTASAIRHLLEKANFRKSMRGALRSSANLGNVLENTGIHMSTMSSDKLQRSRVDISRLLRELRIPYKPELERRHLEIVDKIQDGVWAACDSRLIRVALLNLFDNAVKYAFTKYPVTVQAVDHGSHVSVAITNIGPHIEAGAIDKIFKPFQRVTYKGVQAMPGTGLGLPVSKRIAEVHGGQIDVRSEVISNEGAKPARTTFTLRIPKGTR